MGFRSVGEDFDGLEKFLSQTKKYSDMYFYPGNGELKPLLARCMKLFENVEGYCQSVLYAPEFGRGFTLHYYFNKSVLLDWRSLQINIVALIEGPSFVKSK